MKVMVLLEQRFHRTPDGAVYAPVIYSYNFFTRYLDVFEGVVILARILDEAKVPADWLRCDGPGVTFAAMPHYLGPYQYLARRGAIKRAIRETLRAHDGAFIGRLPSTTMALVESELQRAGRPYAVEVIGDPEDVFSAGASRSLFRGVIRHMMVRALRRQCAGATGASYVTKLALQKKYPPAPGAPTTHYSSIMLKPEACVDRPRTLVQREKYRLVFVGHLNQMYKAPDIMLQASSLARQKGLVHELVLMGDGQHRPEMEALARSLPGVEAIFLGNISDPAKLRAELDKGDLFVLPTRAEGLPRAVIEAMARALPCITTSVGGIPELLPPEDRVPLNDPVALADRIVQFLNDPEGWNRRSARNLETAREYLEDILRQRRITFYKQILERTAAQKPSKA